MIHIRGEIVIGRLVEDVFDYVADQSNEPMYHAQGKIEPHGMLKLIGPVVAWIGRRQELRIWTGLRASSNEGERLAL